MKTSTEKQEAAKKKREVLKSISRKARIIRELRSQTAANEHDAMYWASQTINEMLFKVLYRKGEATEFKTFWQWKTEGKTIKKGEKAYLIWGQPLRVNPKAKEEKPKEKEAESDSEFDFWPICYLFSNLQVV